MTVVSVNGIWENWELKRDEKVHYVRPLGCLITIAIATEQIVDRLSCERGIAWILIIQMKFYTYTLLVTYADIV